MKITKLLSFSIILLLSLSSFAFAAGSSTDTTNQANNQSEEARIANTPCGELTTVQERIKCRLERRSERAGLSDESCQGLQNRASCIALYRNSESCYEKTNREKAMCFREKTGVSRLGLAQSGNPEKRQYMVLLLYELQERVEEQVDDNILTADEGAQLITKIVEAKQSILNDEPKETIRTNMIELKSLWQEIKTQ